MSRRRKIVWLAALLALAGGIGGFCWHWHATAVDRKVRALVYEAAGWPDGNMEKHIKAWKLDFLLREKPKPKEWYAIRKELLELAPAAVPELAELLKNENTDIARYAAFALGFTGNPRAVDALIQILQNDQLEQRIRLEAILSLGQLGDPRAVEILKNIFQHGDWRREQKYASLALFQIGGSEAADALANVLKNHKNKEGSEYDYVILALAEMGDPRAVEPLLDIVTQEHYFSSISFFHEEAALLIGNIGDRRAVDPLIKLLDSEECYTKKTVALALGKLGDVKAIKPLIELLRKDHSFRLYAAFALGELGNEEAIEPLVKLIGSDNEETIMAMIQAICKIGGKKAIDALIIKWATFTPDHNRIYYEIALGLLGNPPFLGDTSMLDPLLKTLDSDEPPGIRACAAMALGQIGDRKAVEPLIKALQRSDWNYLPYRMGRQSDLHIPSYEERLKHLMYELDPFIVHKHAAYALGELGDWRAIEPLKVALDKAMFIDETKVLKETIVKIQSTGVTPTTSLSGKKKSPTTCPFLMRGNKLKRLVKMPIKNTRSVIEDPYMPFNDNTSLIR
ncbi:MAG: HEAT repeat domain-containing protein [Planctomycetes bacterium]|nr:HEAT repeat domain-containing protein [Planctomycetota bacterium]